MTEERAKLMEAALGLSETDALSVPKGATGEEQWTALEQLSHLWGIERSYTEGLINGISLEGFVRTATSPVLGTLTVFQWIRSSIAMPGSTPLKSKDGRVITSLASWDRNLIRDRCAWTGLPRNKADNLAAEPKE